MNKILLYVGLFFIFTSLVLFSIYNHKYISRVGWSSLTTAILSSEWGNAIISSNTQSSKGTTNKCAIIIANGYGSTGSFSSAVEKKIQRAINNGKDITYHTIPKSNYAKTNGNNINLEILAVIYTYSKNAKILVSAHSIAAIGAYNYPYTGVNSQNVSYLLYDPPYNAGYMAPEWLRIFPDFAYIGQAANGAQITRAKNNRIASSSKIIDWTNGLKKKNAETTKGHVLFETKPEVLNGIYNWAMTNCPDKKPIVCDSFGYNEWSSCNIDGLQTRTVASSSPIGCVGGNPILSQSAFTYSPWSTCTIKGTQTRTILTSSPDICPGTEPVLTQNCTPSCTTFSYSPWTPTACPASGTQTHTILASSPSGCTGGNPILTRTCTPACTSFTYSPWTPAICPASGIQTHTETSRIPTGCSGTPVLSQGCTYVPPVTCTSFTYSPWTPTICPASGTQTHTVSASLPTGCVGGSPVLSQICGPELYNSDRPGGQTDWNTGKSYCQNLPTIGGSKPGTMWRLPTKDELVNIYSNNNGKPSSWYGNHYWSGTTWVGWDGISYAYEVLMSTGQIGYSDLEYGVNYVHCIR